MAERHPIFGNMAIIAEGRLIMAFAAVGRFAFGVKAMTKFIIAGMSFRGQVIAAMTFHAGRILLMAAKTPIAISVGPVAMLIPPADWMNIAKGDLIGMADLTAGIGFDIVVAVQTKTHFRHILH
jgi:hypothetical protein